jgi:predicted hotdog family 3-hydroxylacyl-ACP dehydratase
MQLDRAWIESHIPHHGRMCLLDAVLYWSADRIRCSSSGHRAADHALRAHGRLGAACGIELAAQAMAVHGALSAGALGAGAPGAGPPAADASKVRPNAGFLASVRGVRLHVSRLDDVQTDLICDAVRMAGDHGIALYEFELRSAARRLVSGRATVLLDGNYRLAL